MLAAVEQALVGEPVVVVGVHSPKFPTEADASFVRDAVRRHAVTHPVLVDSSHAVWSAYGIRAWPTLVILGADGVIVGQSIGEPDVQPLLALFRDLLERQAALLAHEPLPLAPEPASEGAFAYPGGITTGAQGRIYVADTGHHQIVCLDGDGSELTRYGNGRSGLVDGQPDDARFHYPHGLAVDGDRIIVADAGNHVVRGVELATGEVTTLAGTGNRGRSLRGGSARDVDLRSPWDVAVNAEGELLVAMAGSHQLWILTGGEVRPWAGTGDEARVDGELPEAAFAQPSGLSLAPGGLYVADSESSSVRRVSGSRVTTIAGGEAFSFGLADGCGGVGRFQHPVGIAPGPPGELLVADTLNHCVRVIELDTLAVSTLFGDGNPLDAAAAPALGPPELPADARRAAFCREPEAVAFDGSRVLLADTGNHRVLALSPQDGSCEVLARSPMRESVGD